MSAYGEYNQAGVAAAVGAGPRGGAVTESIAVRAVRPAGVDMSTHPRRDHWLFWEAELLDQRRFREWLSLLADDISYRMPRHHHHDAPN